MMSNYGSHAYYLSAMSINHWDPRKTLHFAKPVTEIMILPLMNSNKRCVVFMCDEMVMLSEKEKTLMSSIIQAIQVDFDCQLHLNELSGRELIVIYSESMPKETVTSRFKDSTLIMAVSLNGLLTKSEQKRDLWRQIVLQ